MAFWCDGLPGVDMRPSKPRMHWSARIADWWMRLKADPGRLLLLVVLGVPGLVVCAIGGLCYCFVLSWAAAS
jgi:hypothetical protein